MRERNIRSLGHSSSYKCVEAALCTSQRVGGQVPWGERTQEKLCRDDSWAKAWGQIGIQLGSWAESAFWGGGSVDEGLGYAASEATNTCLLLPSLLPPNPGLLWRLNLPSLAFEPGMPEVQWRGHSHIVLFYSLLRMQIVLWCISGLFLATWYLWWEKAPSPIMVTPGSSCLQ